MNVTAVGDLLGVNVVHSSLAMSWESRPDTKDLQSRARDGRYGLLFDACRQDRVRHVLVAHHLDDQCETFLMRVARASGLTGLTCMLPSTSTPSGVDIVRPLLSVPKSRLVAFCRASLQSWKEDASNQNLLFDRVRARTVVQDLPEDTLALVGATASRMPARAERARQVCDSVINESCVWIEAASPICWVDLYRLRRCHPAVLRLVLTTIVKRVSGEDRVRVKPMDEFVAGLFDGEAAHGWRQVFGCRVQRRMASLVIAPDYTRGAARPASVNWERVVTVAEHLRQRAESDLRGVRIEERRRRQQLLRTADDTANRPARVHVAS